MHTRMYMQSFIRCMAVLPAGFCFSCVFTGLSFDGIMSEYTISCTLITPALVDIDTLT